MWSRSAKYQPNTMDADAVSPGGMADVDALAAPIAPVPKPPLPAKQQIQSVSSDTFFASYSNDSFYSFNDSLLRIRRSKTPQSVCYMCANVNEKGIPTGRERIPNGTTPVAAKDANKLAMSSVNPTELPPVPTACNDTSPNAGPPAPPAGACTNVRRPSDPAFHKPDTPQWYPAACTAQGTSDASVHAPVASLNVHDAQAVMLLHACKHAAGAVAFDTERMFELLGVRAQSLIDGIGNDNSTDTLATELPVFVATAENITAGNPLATVLPAK